MSRLQERYLNETVPALVKKFEYTSVMQVPKLEKIVVNMGVGDAINNPKALEEAVEESKTEDNISFIEDPEKSETDIQSEPLPETSEKIDSEVSDMVTTVGPLPETGVDAEEECGGMPWWAIALIAVAAAGIGIGVTLLLLKYKKK